MPSIVSCENVRSTITSTQRSRLCAMSLSFSRASSRLCAGPRRSPSRPGPPSPLRTSAAFAAKASRKTSPSAFPQRRSKISRTRLHQLRRDAGRPRPLAAPDRASKPNPDTRTLRGISPTAPVLYLALDYSTLTPSSVPRICPLQFRTGCNW